MTPYAGTHNTNTMGRTMPYIELMFVLQGKKKWGVPIYRRHPMPVGDAC